MWSLWCPSIRVVSAGGTHKRSGQSWKNIVSEMLRWIERPKGGPCGDSRSVCSPARPSLGTRAWDPEVSRSRPKTLNRFDARGRSSSTAEVPMVGTPAVVRRASNPSVWRAMEVRRKWSNRRLRSVPRAPFNQTEQVRQIVIDEDERSQAREVVRVRDPLAVAQVRGHPALVEAGLAEAVILGQAVVEDQADLEETEDAKVVVIMTGSKNSCLP